MPPRQNGTAESAHLAAREQLVQRLLDDLNAYYAGLRADPEAWAEELKERAEWDATLADGIERGA